MPQYALIIAFVSLVAPKRAVFVHMKYVKPLTGLTLPFLST